LEGEVAVEGLVDEAVVEVVEDNMVVDKIVGDCIVDMVAGIMVDSMEEVFEAFVVGSLGFVELGGKLGILAKIHHGPACRPLKNSS